MKLIVPAALVAAMLSGCATSPKDIAPTYVSPVTYQNYSCTELGQEAQRVANRAAALTGQQSQQATRDAVAVTAAIVVFWPAAFFIGGDKTNAAELASLKGQLQAIEQASIARKCNIQFQH